MRVAYCLYGRSSGEVEKYGGLPIGFKKGYESFRKHFFNVNDDVDVFIHTWGNNYEKEIKDFYKPVKSIFEKQIVFDRPGFFSNFFYKNSKHLNKKPFYRQNTISRWYSTKKVVDLKKQYEKEMCFRYDCVFLTRFDVVFFTDIIFKEFDMNNFYVGDCFSLFNPDGDKLPISIYYYAERNININRYHKEKGDYTPNGDNGIVDYWFFSGSKIMDSFSELYDFLNDYFDKRLLSNHDLSLYHLRRLKDYGILANIVPIFYDYEDYSLVRRKYIGSIR